eukprot:TRINITY_DN6623_c0_g4_i1.p1 TRINITY_DN6623_c0_g4~~TRINITY_DN6623_c0_g4_i1.p1  ORF type:complete len:193 (+),score=9.43 TRINITY_DN6623_c0_g4_i1:53-631(+)
MQSGSKDKRPRDFGTPKTPKSQRVSISTEEPRVSVDYSATKLNISDAVQKGGKRANFHSLLRHKPSILTGIDESDCDVLRRYGIATVEDLARWEVYRLAHSICIMAQTERTSGGHEDSTMNLIRAVDVQHESKSLRSLCNEPLASLVAVGPRVNEDFKRFGIETIGQLGRWKPAQWAAAIADLALYEDPIYQ